MWDTILYLQVMLKQNRSSSDLLNAFPKLFATPSYHQSGLHYLAFSARATSKKVFNFFFRRRTCAQEVKVEEGQEKVDYADFAPNPLIDQI